MSVAKPQPQTLAMLKMEKNFVAVNQKGYTQHPYHPPTIETLQFLIGRLYQETDELEEALKHGDYNNAQAECADVSNINDYIFETVTQLKQQTEAKKP